MAVTAADTGSRFAPYLPRLATVWAVERPAVNWQAIEGSLVFVDVSGFTALSERLAKRGPVGAEELTEVISSSFAALLSVAYADGGSLLKFGGDALLLLFEGDDHAGRATRSAIRMRSAMRTVGRITTSVGNVRLRMSVGVHGGELHLFRVGRSHKELIVCGPAASQVVTMESTAAAGEIVVSPALAEMIDPRLLGEPKGPGILVRDRRLPPAPEAFPRRLRSPTSSPPRYRSRYATIWRPAPRNPSTAMPQSPSSTSTAPTTSSRRTVPTPWPALSTSSWSTCRLLPTIRASPSWPPTSTMTGGRSSWSPASPALSATTKVAFSARCVPSSMAIEFSH